MLACGWHVPGFLQLLWFAVGMCVSALRALIPCVIGYTSFMAFRVSVALCDTYHLNKIDERSLSNL